MKKILFLAIAVIAISCLKPAENSYYIRTTGRVEINHANIPDTAINNMSVEIMATAKATNGCWSNLNFALTKKSDFEYSLEAFGTFESYGSCADTVIYADTTIVFKPTLTGLYKFIVYKYDVPEKDTMIVIAQPSTRK
jgi:hypothetical protein